MSIEKKNNSYIFDGNPNKFAFPCVSEDGNEFMIAVRTETRATYLKFLKNEIPCEEGQSIFEAAAILAMAYLGDD